MIICISPMCSVLYSIFRQAEIGSFRMFKSIFTRTGFIKRRRPSVTVALLSFFLISTMPMTASCQRAAGDSERGLQALRALVAGSNGKPRADELLEIERRYNK